MELPFDCGCDNRREIMGSGEWQQDAIAVAAVLVIAAIVWGVTR